MFFLRLATSTASFVVSALLASSALAYPVTVKSCNRDVTFEAAPSRAVSNDVNLTEMMLALKLQDRMVAIPASPAGRPSTQKSGRASRNCPNCRPSIRPRKCC